jgi:hypothetical protein
MITKASIVVMSHLSDAQVVLQEYSSIMRDIVINGACIHINFAKYVMLQCNNDLNKEINPDALWEAFTKTSYYKG